MDWIKLFLISCLFLVGCAEINPLTGGDEDNVAPKIVTGTQQPEQGTTNFNGTELRVKFDEYFTLKDPSTSITMNPSAGALKTSVNRKELTVQWSENLLPNTTYIVQLNGTVTDLNEKNDSIIQFVFSTGNEIDSLAISGLALNAFTNEAYSNATIGLFLTNTDPLTTEPLYATRSDKFGKFSFNYIKAGEFQPFAFDDKNKDRKYTPGEAYGFLPENCNTAVDSNLTIPLFYPKLKTAGLQASLIKPSAAIVYGKDLSEGIRINNEAVEVINNYSNDSVLVELPRANGNFYSITNGSDTVVKPMQEKERFERFKLSSNLYKNTWINGDTIYLEGSNLIQSIDTSKFSLIDIKGNPVPYTYGFNKANVYLLPDRSTVNSFQLKLSLDAIAGKENTSDSLSITIKTALESDLSVLKINAAILPGNWVIQLMDGKTVIAEKTKKESEDQLVFTQLIPGTYSLRCIEDVNKNQQWDPGSFENKTLSEKVVRFTLEQKLRPNWEIEEVLKLQNP